MIMWYSPTQVGYTTAIVLQLLDQFTDAVLMKTSSYLKAQSWPHLLHQEKDQAQVRTSLSTARNELISNHTKTGFYRFLINVFYTLCLLGIDVKPSEIN